MSEPIRVFLADDHVMVREGLAALLAQDGAIEIVGQCADGLEVIEQVGASGAAVLVLDITMPGLNGLDVCRELTRTLPDLAVLILSVHKNEQFIARALYYGAAGYLVKELAADHLIEAIRRVASGAPYLGPGISRTVLQGLADGGSDPYEKLSSRERQVLQLIAQGYTNPQIAEKLELSPKTVNTHRERLMAKLDLHGIAQLVRFAIARGLVPLE